MGDLSIQWDDELRVATVRAFPAQAAGRTTSRACGNESREFAGAATVMNPGPGCTFAGLENLAWRTDMALRVRHRIDGARARRSGRRGPRAPRSLTPIWNQAAIACAAPDSVSPPQTSRHR